jgi:hypothetical protein
MDPSLQDLELQRKDLLRQMEKLGDFRRSTISVNYRKCGKSNCVCARKDHPGHGPQYLWNVSVSGKTQARNLPLGPELEKVEKEVERYHPFLRLSQELVEVNSRICQLRPVRNLEDENELSTTSKPTKNVCAMPSFASKVYFLVPGCSKLAARRSATTEAAGNALDGQPRRRHDRPALLSA